ncbi:MAG: hypothetical protein CFE23_09715 [Flavobacterium sp. BFFFF1]|uniref:DUF4870 domain-containing protein n=1 Tax=Flavobacterium sp. BFFFF1 TaxID=2015557 RepID=UPI000BDA3193|nr:DUF4870 domain-containing protein [Flavobacterium sp. BFFFF1]OYU80333.1 MAG: hypothetical protein CFE23_09715 [Flavobacterium sp. BFFFF1]
MNTTNYNTTASIMHLSTFSQYLFPLGNFVFPIVIWSSTKDKSAYVDQQGKEVINFQLSIFIYQVLLAAVAIPILAVTILKNLEINTAIHDNELFIRSIEAQEITGVVIAAIIAIVFIIMLQFFEFLMTIYAAVKTSNGENFSYPLAIKFLK